MEVTLDYEALSVVSEIADGLKQIAEALRELRPGLDHLALSHEALGCVVAGKEPPSVSAPLR